NALIQHLGGYCKAIEDELDCALAGAGTGYRTRVWENSVAPLVKRPASWFLVFVFGSAWLAAISVSGLVLNESRWSGWWSVVSGLGYVATAAVLVGGFSRGNRLFNEA